MPNFTDGRITESSGAAYSLLYPGNFYTNNDENTAVFLVFADNGNTTGTFTVKGATLIDPECVRVDAQARLWVCDIGDNSSNRSTVAVYQRGEPGPGNLGPLDFTKYVLNYSDGPRNAESFLTHPDGVTRYVISKESNGRLYKLPDNLSVTGTNTMTFVQNGLGTNVSDATFTPDGRFVLTRRAGQNTTVYVHDPASSWAQIDTITVPSLTKPEGITVAGDQLSFLITSEGQYSPFYNVAMPSAYQPLAPGPSPSNPCG